MEAEAGKRKAPEPSEPSAGEGLPESGWTKEQVADWLRSSDYAGMQDALQGVNGKMLLGFSEEQLKGSGGMVGVALYNQLHPAEDERGT